MQYSILINGFTAINLAKLSVLTGLDKVKIGVSYKYKGQYMDTMPACLKILSECEVQYEVLPGWEEGISKCKMFEDFPENVQRYVLRVQELLGVLVRRIGVGPNCLDQIDCGNLWDFCDCK